MSRAALLAVALLGCAEPVADDAPAERYTYLVREPGDLVPVGGWASLEVFCDPGDLVIAGGCQITGDGALGSYPHAERSGWICASAMPGPAIAYAICEADR